MTSGAANLKAIFHEALGRPAGPDRQAYLHQACGSDAALLDQVESLLRAYLTAGHFLDSDSGQLEATQAAPFQVVPAAALDQTVESVADPGQTTRGAESSLAEGPGTVIGPYKLLQTIGEGGMGTVFMAEQERPIRRKVALKVIKPGMDTRQVIARFEAERQALALMDHPHIARVLDAGATATGRPFFVMELVRGVPITEYCDRNHLTPQERLALFIPVCQAIQHAHQKGIIHRDIKPSNVLVTLYEGKPEAKVIDFGVAKAIEQRLTERTMFTEFGAVVGTLEYMSPEQAEMGQLDIDTRSDVYSLGVLLYELLTGSTPLEKAKLRKAAYTEILRRIREEEPPKPSTRLSDSHDALPSISAQRRTEPARLSKLVRGDLDWIVMKALDKDRTRRYETANGFARDIQRYLDGDAVEASPPSARYKLGKFARKHRAGLAVAGAFAALLLLATLTSTGLAFWANHERVRATQAERAAEAQLSRAQKAEVEALAQRGRAEEREAAAIAAVKRFGDVVRDNPELKNTPALAPLRKTLLKEPQAFYGKLRDDLLATSDATPASLTRLAGAWTDLGRLTQDIGDRQDALRAFKEALAIYERLVAGDPSNLALRLSQVRILFGIRRLLDSTMNAPDQALSLARQTLALCEQLATDHPTNVEVTQHLADCWSDLCHCLVWMNRKEEAVIPAERCIAILEGLAHDQPANRKYSELLSMSLMNLGSIQGQIDRLVESLATHERCALILDQLYRSYPNDKQLLTNQANALYNLAYTQNKLGRFADALRSYERVRLNWEEIAQRNPSDTNMQRVLSDLNLNISLAQISLGQYDEALVALDRSIASLETIQTADDNNLRANLLARRFVQKGIVLRKMNRAEEAWDIFERARAMLEPMAHKLDIAADEETQSDLAEIMANLGYIRREAGRLSEALELFRRAAEVRLRLTQRWPEKLAQKNELINIYKNIFGVLAAMGRQAEAAAIEAKTQLVLDEFIAKNPADIARNSRLTAVLKGVAPVDNAERLELAYWAIQRRRPGAAARLFAAALASDPNLAASRQTQHAYNAACVATLASSGEDKDAAPLDEAARVELRRQALQWLRSELATWGQICDSGDAKAKPQIVATMDHWKNDPDLNSIRDSAQLAHLPDAERAAFQQLWADVDALQVRARANP